MSARFAAFGEMFMRPRSVGTPMLSNGEKARQLPRFKNGLFETYNLSGVMCVEGLSCLCACCMRVV